MYKDIVYYDGLYYFFPLQGESIIKVNSKEEKASIVEEKWLENICDYSKYWVMEGYSKAKETNDRIIIFNCRKGVLCIFSKENKSWEVIPVELNISKEKERSFFYLGFKNIANEQYDVYTLDSFIEYVNNTNK